MAGASGWDNGQAKNMDASAWAAWVQAIGSILAIGAGFGTVIYQNRRADHQLEVERKSRAEVVALRLSVWLGEIGGRVDKSLRRLREERERNPEEPPRLWPTFVAELKLGMVVRIDQATR